MLLGRNDATAAADEAAVISVAAAEAILLAVNDDGDDGTMEAFACIRVRIVSTGWMARVEMPPEIQPAVKSTQDDSLGMSVRGVTKWPGRGGPAGD